MFYDCRWQLQCPISPWEFWRFLGGFRRSRNCHHPLICVFVWMYDVLMCSWVQDDYKYGGRIHVERLLFVPKGKHPYVTEHAFFDKNKKKIAVQKSRKHVLPDSVSDLLGTTLSFRQFVAKRKQSPLHKRIESTADHCQKTKSPFSWKKMSQKIALRGHIRDVLWSCLQLLFFSTGKKCCRMHRLPADTTAVIFTGWRLCQICQSF